MDAGPGDVTGIGSARSADGDGPCIGNPWRKDWTFLDCGSPAQYAVISPQETGEYSAHDGGQIVIVGACSEHVLPVQLWCEERSLDGHALVLTTADLHSNYRLIFGGIETPVVRLQHAV